MLKDLIRQWLCYHNKTKVIRRIVIEEDFGNYKEKRTVGLKIWTKCLGCEKIEYHKII